MGSFFNNFFSTTITKILLNKQLLLSNTLLPVGRTPGVRVGSFAGDAWLLFMRARILDMLQPEVETLLCKLVMSLTHVSVDSVARRARSSVGESVLFGAVSCGSS